MDRREFVAMSIGAPLVAAGGSPDDDGREYYELRQYHLKRGPKVKVADDFFQQVAIPAMKRAGAGTIGVFGVQIGPASPSLYVLITHRSAASVLALPAKLAADADYQKSGADFLARPAADAVYDRVESSLMVAFAGMPKLEVPEKKNRFFELRTYESHGEAAGDKKVEMFNNGEIAIFRKAGLRPVFFGQTLIGARMPNLTYMLVYDDNAARDAAWGKFVSDPDWRKLSTTPGYLDAEIVTGISNAYLRPTGYSEI